MMSIKRALKNNRLMRATTRLSAPKFNKLVKSFDQELKKDTFNDKVMLISWDLRNYHLEC